MDPSDKSKLSPKANQNARDRVAMIMSNIEADTKAELKRELIREAKVNHSTYILNPIYCNFCDNASFYLIFQLCVH